MSLRSLIRFAAASMAALPVVVHADTVASLLGNFTVNQFSRLTVSARAIDVRYSVVYGQLPALRELHLADTDRDGVTTDAERAAHADALAAALAYQLSVTVDGKAVPLRATRTATSLPAEQGGFSLRLDVDLAGDLPPAGDARREVAFANNANAGRFGWQEIVVNAAPGTSVFDTDAFSTSLTGGLTESLQALPASGPLAERGVHFAYRQGPLPAGAQPLRPRPGAADASPAAETAQPPSSWLARQTRHLVDLISAQETPPHVALWALLAAMLLGALHAFSPGHGKTVVGAYLIGSRATARHAAFLGVTVTVTHTLGVFALGAATFVASAYVLPERVYPILGLASGLLVLGMGLVLVVQRWPAARAAWRSSADRFRSLATPPRGRHVLAAVNHAHAAAGWHSHGGTWHSHLPPDASADTVTWRSLLALGVSGGLVPCPSAMVLLLAAVALNKTAFGLALVVAFSLGLAATLTAVGLLFLYARNRIPDGARAPRFLRVLPLGSAAVIALVGLLLCYGALTGGQV